MLRSLPPAGNPITLQSVDGPDKVFESVFGDRSVFLYGSGTMALAASLVAIRKHRDITSPEVLLPAYACPDLVSAALFAGVKPVLVDLEPDTPWMDLSQLQQKLGPNTIAVIAAHFLGIPERLAEIRQRLEGSGVLIIEDSAQLFPVGPTAGVWESDLVVLSFGRGKPISLLGGGAVLCRQDSLAECLPISEETKLEPDKIQSEQARALYKIKIQLYNILLEPWAYGLLKLLPFLHLGETIYHPLEKIYSFEISRIGMLAANIEAYVSRERVQQDWLSTMLKSMVSADISDLTILGTDSIQLPILRYPVLVKNEALRDRLIDKMIKAGLGCSKMYPVHLPRINGIEDVFQKQGDFPQAMRFSKRLLTFPCHTGVSRKNIELMKDILEENIKL
jgi:dTDP-4-amino-4,6-dideoxygalactose transaminase